VTPEFRELEIRFVREDATRLAMLLAGEAHIVELPRVLQKDALARGMKVTPSSLPSFQAVFLLGGLYFATPDKLDSKTTPWVDRRVREALNRAVNRKEIVDSIFQGRAELLRVFGYHPTLPGWNPEWEKRFDEMYGFDPVKAKVLLNQAGYPQGFPIKIFLAPCQVPQRYWI
jgi:ABC-type transport system substrate-binding protein